MFESIYSGYSGLLSFSRGLDVLSNNVANMNTPGFKATELTFRDLMYRFSLDGGNTGGNASLQMGEGVDTASTRIRFHQGDLHETNNELDTSIDGNGFFILRQDGRTFYSRAGQFEFNDDGILVQHSSGAHVMALNNGTLAEISIVGSRTNPSKTTSNVSLHGTLTRGNAPATNSFDFEKLTVYDHNGTPRTLSIHFNEGTSPTPGNFRWSFEVLDGTTSVASGNLDFAPTGNPLPGTNTFTFNYTPAGVATQSITLNFGDPGSPLGVLTGSGSTNPSAMDILRQDGYGVGVVVEKTFDEDGVLSIKYSNGQTTKLDHLALAWFENLQALKQTGNGLFENDSEQTVIRGVAGEGPMGKIVGKKIELSNVELTEQFTDMVVIQRGYQASSQVISVTNEMIQQLLDLHSRR